MKIIERLKNAMPIMLVVTVVAGTMVALALLAKDYEKPPEPDYSHYYEEYLESKKKTWDSSDLTLSDCIDLLRKEMNDEDFNPGVSFDIPYMGMPLRYLNRTRLGKISEMVYENYQTKCLFKELGKDGKYITIMTVQLSYKKIALVFENHEYWYNDMLITSLFDDSVAEKYPDWAIATEDKASSEYQYHSSSGSSSGSPGSSSYSYGTGTTDSSDDPYDASSYWDPEDFYYEYPEDFDDYEDAADYWYEHHG